MSSGPRCSINSSSTPETRCSSMARMASEMARFVLAVPPTDQEVAVQVNSVMVSQGWDRCSTRCRWSGQS